jgi:ubiquinone/menaquinone biosynthesis C-methylase UbiE
MKQSQLRVTDLSAPGLSPIDLVRLDVGETVLDVATGPGTVARMGAVRAGTSGRVVGTDFSAPMPDIARNALAEPGVAPIEFIQRAADDFSCRTRASTCCCVVRATHHQRQAQGRGANVWEQQLADRLTSTV